MVVDTYIVSVRTYSKCVAFHAMLKPKDFRSNKSETIPGPISWLKWSFQYFLTTLMPIERKQLINFQTTVGRLRQTVREASLPRPPCN